MLNINFNHKNFTRTFLNIFFPFFLCMLISLLVLSYILYFNFENIALKKVYDFQKNDLRSVSHNLANMSDTARMLSIDAFFDSDIINLLYYDDLEPNIYQKAQFRLQSYKNINPFLYSIYVFSGSHFYIEPSTHYQYSKEDIVDRGILTILQDIKKYPSNSLIPRELVDDIQGDNTPKYVYSYLFYDSQVQSGQISEAIILNISENWLRSNIDSLKTNNNNRILIIDEQGKLMISDTKIQMLTDLSTYQYIQSILSSGDSSGFLRTEIDGVDTFVAYLKTGVLNYTFLSITPYSEIIGEIDTMKKISYLSVLLITILAVLIIFLLSKRLYNPIISLVQKLTVFESENKRSFIYRKNEYLKTLVRNSSALDATDLDKDFSQYNIEFIRSQPLILVILKIDNFYAFCDDYNLSDRNRMKSKIMTLAHDLCSHSYNNDYIDIGDDHMILIMNIDESNIKHSNAEFTKLMQSIQNNTQQYLQISLSISVSDVFIDLTNLSNFYNVTLDASYNRLYLGHKCLIFVTQIDHLPSADFCYSIANEKQFIECVNLGHYNDAMVMLYKIFDTASEFGFSSLNLTVLRSLLSLNNTIESLNITNSIRSDYKFSTLLNQLNRLETLDEIKQMFSDIVYQICQQSDQNTDIKHRKLLDSVIEIIRNEFQKTDLSLDSISDRLGISSSYLSRLFKKQTALSMVEYINRTRIEKANELLTTTDESISTVMEKTGFTSRSHFYTLYKKKYGSSPGNMKFSNKMNNSNK